MSKTVQFNHNPGSRIDVGDAILAAGATTDTKAVKGELAAFTKAHRDYGKAEAAVEKAAGQKRKQEARVAELDLEQDEAVARLAASATADGLPKANPFKPLDANKPIPSPSAIQKMGYAAEAKVVHRVAKLMQRRKGLSAGTVRAAKKADDTATAIEAAIAEVAPLGKAYSAAVAKREALAQPWEGTLARLKLAARFADGANGTALYATLFQSQPQKASKPRVAKAAKTAKAPKPSA